MFGTLEVALVLILVGLISFAVITVRKDISKRDSKDTAGIWVQASHHIPVDVRTIKAALLARRQFTPQERQQWNDLVLKTELLFQARYQLLKRSMLEDFSPFDPHLNCTDETPASMKEKLLTRFVSNFRYVLERANFSVLSSDAADAAGAVDFMNTLPIEPEWLRLDPVFAQYMAEHKELASQMPSFSERLWLFTRGVGVAKYTGLMLFSKVDLFLFRLFGRCCGPKRRAVEADASGDADREHAVFVKRQTLASQVTGLGSFLRPVTLIEPTFKEVVMMYRLNAGRDALHNSDNKDAVYIKVFRDIAMADLEVIYPAKSILMRALDVVKFTGAAAYGVLSTLYTIVTDQVDGAWGLIMGFLALAGAIYFDYSYHRNLYQQISLEGVYQKSMDNDKGALAFLLEEVCAQEIKETIIGYYLLSQAKELQTTEALEGEARTLISELVTVEGPRADSAVDPILELDDALDKLEKMQLLVKGDNNRFGVKSMKETLALLDKQWAALVVSSVIDEPAGGGGEGAGAVAPVNVTKAMGLGTEVSKSPRENPSTAVEVAK